MAFYFMDLFTLIVVAAVALLWWGIARPLVVLKTPARTEGQSPSSGPTYDLCSRQGMQQIEIRVRGRVDARWLEWLDGLAITHNAWGETLLTGAILGQAELYGLLSKLRDLGLSLTSLRCEELET